MTVSTTSAWTAGATRFHAFGRGLGVMLTTPGVVLFLTAIGFGTLVRDAGLDLGHALFLSFAMYALPAQVMVVDQLQRGATLFAVAIAVTLTAVRLLPMTVSLQPYLRSSNGARWPQFFAVHFIAITAWIEGGRRLPTVPAPLRLAHFYGIGLGLMLSAGSGAALGFVAAGRLPLLVQAALLFMTPVYFLLSTLAGAVSRSDYLAIAGGAALAPVAHAVSPDLDLLIAGVVGGTVAYLAGKRPA